MLPLEKKLAPSVFRGLLIGSLMLFVLSTPFVTQPRFSSAMSSSWGSGVWSTGDPTTATQIEAYVDTAGWPGSLSSPITFNVLSVTGNDYFLQIAGSYQSNCGVTGPEVTIYYSLIGYSGTLNCYSKNVVDANFHSLYINFYSQYIQGTLDGFVRFYVDGNLIETDWICNCVPGNFEKVLAPDYIIESYYSQYGPDYQNGYSYGYLKYTVSGSLYNEPVYAYSPWVPSGYSCSVPSNYQTGNIVVSSGIAPPNTYMGMTGHSRGFGNSYEFDLSGYTSATGHILSYYVPTNYCNTAIAAP